MMFEGKDWQILQTLIDNGTITKKQKTPQQVLDAIAMTIKSEEHFWHFQDELSDVYQHLDEGIHSLNTKITAFINSCRFSHDMTKETLKIMVLQHVVRYHKASHWIWLQDQFQLTYKALLTHTQLLESQCNQYHRGKEKGQTDLISLLAATSSASSSTRMPSQPSPSVLNVATPTPIPNAWHMARSGLTAIA